MKKKNHLKQSSHSFAIKMEFYVLQFIGIQMDFEKTKDCDSYSIGEAISKLDIFLR